MKTETKHEYPCSEDCGGVLYDEEAVDCSCPCHVETKQPIVGHTPGPWRWRGKTITGAEVSGPDGINGRVICTFGDMWKGNNERSANARLIAAAPDLLAVCKMLDLTRPLKGPKEFIEWLTPLFGAANKALAKAEPCDS